MENNFGESVAISTRAGPEKSSNSGPLAFHKLLFLLYRRFYRTGQTSIGCSISLPQLISTGHKKKPHKGGLSNIRGSSIVRRSSDPHADTHASERYFFQKKRLSVRENVRSSIDKHTSILLGHDGPQSPISKKRGCLHRAYVRMTCVFSD